MASERPKVATKMTARSANRQYRASGPGRRSAGPAGGSGNRLAGLDEHTQTTLVRAAHNLPVPAVELDHAARQLVAALTDPSNEANWLKRPATRTCMHCGGTWRTRLSLLCCSPYCSPACEEASRQLFEELTHVR